MDLLADYTKLYKFVSNVRLLTVTDLLEGAANQLADVHLPEAYEEVQTGPRAKMDAVYVTGAPPMPDGLYAVVLELAAAVRVVPIPAGAPVVGQLRSILEQVRRQRETNDQTNAELLNAKANVVRLQAERDASHSHALALAVQVAEGRLALAEIERDRAADALRGAQIDAEEFGRDA